MKKVKIALLGLGNVGCGVFKILQKNKEEIMKRCGYEIEIAKILVRDINKNRKINVLKEKLTLNFDEIVNDSSIKIIVELIGGINPAKEYIIKAIEAKKHIVTANKMLLAIFGDEIFKKVEENKVMFKYEASVAGGIPIINGINENLTANKINKLYGIVNGTTNYILSKMELENLEFNYALEEAKKNGYAEADPSSDIEGFDAQYKLAILSSLAFGSKIGIDDVYREGISKIKPIDMKYASDFGMAIKLLAIAKEYNGVLELRVHPTMISETHPLANVYDSFNAIFINGNAVGDLMFYGRGAGDLPTGSSVVSDIISILRRNIEQYNTYSFVRNNLWEKKIKNINEVESRYYIRINVDDKPGVLGQITTIFGSNKVSLKSVIQKGRKVNENMEVTLVLITHKTKEYLINDSIDKLYDLRSIKSIENLIRIEDFN